MELWKDTSYQSLISCVHNIYILIKDKKDQLFPKETQRKKRVKAAVPFSPHSETTTFLE